MTRFPIYADFPIAHQLMQKDIKQGNERFTLDRETYSGDKPFTSLMLNRLEYVVQNDLMPPFLYLTMHWNGRLSNEEKESVLAWIANERSASEARNKSTSTGYANEPVEPLPLTIALDPDKVSLGRKLFLDPRLSNDNSIACSSCHDAAKGGTDHSRVPTGIGGQAGSINTPTVFNAMYNLAQFWDGRAKDLQDQAARAVTSPHGMAGNWQSIVAKLNQVREYKEAFLALYPDQGVSKTSVTDAIAVFEKSLITPDARFDQYLRGNENALNENEKEGYNLFKQNCTACHFGIAFGGMTYEKLGYAKD